jgi:hypothetical protein
MQTYEVSDRENEDEIAEKPRASRGRTTSEFLSRNRQAQTAARGAPPSMPEYGR